MAATLKDLLAHATRAAQNQHAARQAAQAAAAQIAAQRPAQAPPPAPGGQGPK